MVNNIKLTWNLVCALKVHKNQSTNCKIKKKNKDLLSGVIFYIRCNSILIIYMLGLIVITLNKILLNV